MYVIIIIIKQTKSGSSAIGQIKINIFLQDFDILVPISKTTSLWLVFLNFPHIVT